MKKLDDIPKKVNYTVPEGYFDRLPGVIQSRIADGKAKPFQLTWGFSLKMALPILAIAAIGLFWYQQAGSLEEKLDQFSEEQLAYFLDDTDLTAEELAETMTWSTEDLDALEDDVFATLADSGSDLDQILEDYTLDELENF